MKAGRRSRATPCPAPSVIAPAAFAPEPDALYRNNGDGTFRDVSRGGSPPAGNGLGVAIADWDDDGRLDIFVANDQTPKTPCSATWAACGSRRSRYRGGSPTTSPGASGPAWGRRRRLRRGRPIDLLVTNFYEEGSTLYRNAAPGRFVVETSQARLMAPSRSKLGFGAGFLDFDNDGAARPVRGQRPRQRREAVASPTR